MAAAEQRLADLERQIAELRRDFNAGRLCMQAAFDTGYEAGQASVTGPLRTLNEMRLQRDQAAAQAAVPSRRPRHLSVVGGRS
jgi:hypothetical protein